MTAWPFNALTPLSYDLIVIDPPWHFETWSDAGKHKSAAHHYSLMDLDDIKALPIGGLAQRDCLVLMWAISPMLPAAFEVFESWGVQYKSSLAWRKTTARGKVRVGPGYWVRTMHEPILLGTIGNPSKASGFPSIFDGLAREHSRKPDEFYALVEKHTTGLRRADIFGRQSRPGWEVWGDQATHFDAVAA